MRARRPRKRPPSPAVWRRRRPDWIFAAAAIQRRPDACLDPLYDLPGA
jgi:hypothetical protein